MNRGDKLAWAGVIIVTLEGAAFTRSGAYHLYCDNMSAGKLSIAVVGWALATYGPIVVAALLWRLAKRSSVPWLLHIMLLPSFYGLLLAGNSLMLSTLYVRDFDDTMGAPIMPALFVSIATMVIYFSALVAEQVSRLKRRSNGG